ncbi:IclR family transcriptional regulator [Natrarchaeobius sp. A-rgal3]|uniref:IclR family transcriptional regulator n=1 Tax=Natrarchaeobius versutus TaxID=1679078 RepID=UPI003510CAE0
MGQRDSKPVQAAATTFEVIEALRELNGAGVSELASYLEMPKSTVHDHLRTLESAEYLVNDGEQYRVGARFLELGGYARRQMRLYRLAQPEIEKLAERTGEHANLMIEEHGRGIFLYKAKGADAVQLDTHAGMRVHLQTTALGKTILAHYPENRVHDILDRHGMPEETDRTVTDREALFEQLETVRERRYATDDEERVEGMRCVAAPIRGSNGTVLGAVSVSGPTSRMDEETFTKSMPKTVLSTANVIEVNMAHS